MDIFLNSLNSNLPKEEISEDEAMRESIISAELKNFVLRVNKRHEYADLLKEGTAVVGYKYEGNFDIETFINSLLTTGFQATNLGKAINILREVREQQIPLYLGFTSNIGTCGLRETITYLTKNFHVRALATTAGAVEEDVMKVFNPFILGESRTNDRELFRRCINRTGNIFIPDSHYMCLHSLLYSMHKRLLQTHIKTQGYIDVVEYVYELGHQLEILNVPHKEDSFVYWAYKNKIDLYCPALLDGAMGDGLYWFQRKIKERFVVDIMGYIKRLTDDMILAKAQTGGIALWAIGGSVPKHMLCNSAIFVGGANYGIYVNTATEADGSNAGAPIDEAITWGKFGIDAKTVKIEAEATLVVPLIVTAAYQCYKC